MRLPKKDSATWRGIITGVQGFVGAIPVLAIGLWTATKAVPGCNEAITDFFFNNLVLFAGSVGVSGGVVSTAWNIFFRKDVKNY